MGGNYSVSRRNGHGGGAREAWSMSSGGKGGMEHGHGVEAFVKLETIRAGAPIKESTCVCVCSEELHSFDLL
jgi:hypothetical protein